MLDPASAIGLAASLVQITSFMKGILSDSHELYRSADGALVQNLELEAVCRRLDGLVLKLDKNNARLTSPGSQATEVDQQLATLSLETRKITKELLERLEKLKLNAGDSKWKSVRRAIESVVKSKDLEVLENRLSKHRDQIDTALLLSQREWAQEFQDRQQSQSKQMKSSVKMLLKELRLHRGLLKQLQSTHPIDAEDMSPTIPMSFSSALLSAVVDDDNQKIMQQHARRTVEMLHYDDMPQRHDAIPEAYRKTFEWMFEKVDSPALESDGPVTHAKFPDSTDVDLPRQPDMHVMRQRFTEWMESERQLYWITGKPGAGKSTLMKFLYHDPRTIRAAQEWNTRVSNDQSAKQLLQLCLAAFFFWIAGTKIQRSKEGQLRTLLYQLLQTDPELALEAFPQRTRRCKLFGSDERDFSYSELIAALDFVLSQQDKSYLLFIDGLDEFDGNHAELVALMHKMSSKAHVKICVASRPWTIFEDAFENTSLIRIEYLTRADILQYITGKLQASRRFIELQRFKSKESKELMFAIAEKASGVFLWVYLVVDTLLNGLIDGDDVTTLFQRLDDLPSDLETLFSRILNDVSPSHAAEASKIFQFFQAYPQDSTLLGVYLFDTPWAEAIQTDIQPYTNEEAQYYADTMRRRLYSRCKCFLEVDNPSSPSSKIRYLHRTARDYIVQPTIWDQIVGMQPAYDPHRAVFVSRLMRSKVIDIATNPASQIELYQTLLSIVQDKAINEIEPITDRIELIDSADQTGREQHQRRYQSATSLSSLRTWVEELANTMRPNERPWPDTMFKLAFVAGLDWYVSSKLTREPSLLAQRIGGQYALVTAVRQEMWAMQDVLLDSGADPNRHEGSNSAWEILVYQSWTTRTKWLSDKPLQRQMLRALVKFLDHGADPEAHYDSGGNDNIGAKDFTKKFCEFLSSSSPAWAEELKAAYTAAWKRDRLVKRKMLLPWLSL